MIGTPLKCSATESAIARLSHRESRSSALSTLLSPLSSLFSPRRTSLLHQHRKPPPQTFCDLLSSILYSSSLPIFLHLCNAFAFIFWRDISRSTHIHRCELSPTSNLNIIPSVIENPIHLISSSEAEKTTRLETRARQDLTYQFSFSDTAGSQDEQL